MTSIGNSDLMDLFSKHEVSLNWDILTKADATSDVKLGGFTYADVLRKVRDFKSDLEDWTHMMDENIVKRMVNSKENSEKINHIYGLLYKISAARCVPSMKDEMKELYNALVHILNLLTVGPDGQESGAACNEQSLRISDSEEDEGICV